MTGHNWAEYFACNQCTHAFHSHRHVYIDVQCAEGSSVAFTECQAEGCDPESCGERTVFTPTNNCIERGDSSGEWRTVRWSPHPPEIPEGEPGAWFSVDATSPVVTKPPKTQARWPQSQTRSRRSICRTGFTTTSATTTHRCPPTTGKLDATPKSATLEASSTGSAATTAGTGSMCVATTQRAALAATSRRFMTPTSAVSW